MNRLLQQMVSAQARQRPQAPAIVLQGQRICFEELDSLSNQLARALKQAGCERGDRVAILMPKSIPAIAAILGTLKADCAYVPMDASSPSARLEVMIRTCEARCVLTMGAAAARLPAVLANLEKPPFVGWMGPNEPQGVAAAFGWQDLPALPSGPIDYRNSPQDLAHILFTSGSTGVPKGVMITHANVSHYVDWCTNYFDYRPGDRISGHPPLIFDLSTMDIYATLSAGATLYPVTPEMSLLPNKLADFIREAELTQWFSVPSLLNYMARFDVIRQDDFPAMKRLLWCGEPFPVPALIHWMRKLPHVQFTNLYGPTEATIASSYYTMPRVPASETELTPIGVACAGEDLRVLDESRNPVAVGEIGELYIGGAGLSPGYWRDPEKTAAVFFPDPLNPGQRIYKTGDLASVDANGLFYVHGRTDSQIKSRGYRIELGEIERAFNAVAGLKECAVVAVDTGGFEGATICCAYSLKDGVELDSRQLRSRVAELIPSYMVPALWLQLPALPQNANGKIDRPNLRTQFQAMKGGVASTS
ncbi:MAG: amino acid adenylation domain-containing protein [Bryobacteraceae bacterium]|nr:amino acid adenylation domain-containing protein [Bryobacteraceae bacterium]